MKTFSRVGFIQKHGDSPVWIIECELKNKNKNIKRLFWTKLWTFYRGLLLKQGKQTIKWQNKFGCNMSALQSLAMTDAKQLTNRGDTLTCLLSNLIFNKNIWYHTPRYLNIILFFARSKWSKTLLYKLKFCLNFQAFLQSSGLDIIKNMVSNLKLIWVIA